MKYFVIVDRRDVDSNSLRCVVAAFASYENAETFKEAYKEYYKN